MIGIDHINHINPIPESFAYKDLIGEDKWVEWTPVRVDWTDSGTPEVTGRFHVIGRQCFFAVLINTVSGSTIATTAGTSYIELPLISEAGQQISISGISTMVDITANTAVGVGVIRAGQRRVYVPTQVASGNNFIVAGWYEI